jgi:CRISPR-associated protein (TIGR02710 family)
MPIALIATVGGTPQPLIETIIQHQPQFVCFLCSQQSVEVIAAIKAGLKEQSGIESPSFEDHKIILDDINDLVHCYTKAQECVRKLQEWSVSPAETVVDFTGGTKTMSVALGLATVEQGYIFSYVGGSKRTKGGMGIVVDGHEEVRTGVSPWSLFAVQERRRIAELFNIYQFLSAETLTRDLISRPALDVRLKRFLEIVEMLCQGYSAWDRFAHKEAVEKIKASIPLLEAYVNLGGHHQYAQLRIEVHENLTWLQQLQQETHGFRKPAYRQVVDLIANAERRAEEGKYDDAVARLYRALELDGQVALSEPPLHIESASDVPVEKIPESVRTEYLRRYRDETDDKIKIGLIATFDLLAEVKHPRGTTFLEHKEQLRAVLASRNHSILAHGLTPINERAFHDLQQILRGNLASNEQVKFAKIPIE